MSDKQERIYAGSQRLYDADFLGRTWVAEYVADVDTELDALRTENARLQELVWSQDRHAAKAQATIERLRAALEWIEANAEDTSVHGWSHDYTLSVLTEIRERARDARGA